MGSSGNAAALAVGLALCLGCASLVPPAPLPPRPPATPWRIGLTFAPFTEAEWAWFADWPAPLWRVEIDQAAVVQARGVPALLVAVAESDASVTALLPYLPGAWGIELGNEPNFAQDAASYGAWVQRMVPFIRATGYTGRILTAGVGNIDNDTLRWLETALEGVPAEVIAGWHCYGRCLEPGQTGRLARVLGGRANAMTESGMDQPTPALEAQAVGFIRQVCDAAYAVGSWTCIGYQTHSAPSGPDAEFGVFRLDGTVRPWAAALRAAAR